MFPRANNNKKDEVHFVGRYGRALYGETLVKQWLEENKGQNLLDFLTDSNIEFVAITFKHYEDRWLWEHTPLRVNVMGKGQTLTLETR